MNRFNGHFDSKFHGCMIIGRLADEGRKRTVTCYAIHDEPTVVGLYDGVDTWVGSASTFGKDVRDRLEGVHVRGEVYEIESGQTRRRLHDAPGVMGYPALQPMPGSKPRIMAKARRMAMQPPQPAGKPRIRAGGAV